MLPSRRKLVRVGYHDDDRERNPCRAKVDIRFWQFNRNGKLFPTQSGIRIRDAEFHQLMASLFLFS